MFFHAFGKCHDFMQTFLNIVSPFCYATNMSLEEWKGIENKKRFKYFFLRKYYEEKFKFTVYSNILPVKMTQTRFHNMQKFNINFFYRSYNNSLCMTLELQNKTNIIY